MTTTSHLNALQEEIRELARVRDAVILAHNYEGPKESAPHDHGPSWAIYGQARGETAMNDWSLLEAAGLRVSLRRDLAGRDRCLVVQP